MRKTWEIMIQNYMKHTVKICKQFDSAQKQQQFRGRIQKRSLRAHVITNKNTFKTCLKNLEISIWKKEIIYKNIKLYIYYTFIYYYYKIYYTYYSIYYYYKIIKYY